MATKQEIIKYVNTCTTTTTKKIALHFGVTQRTIQKYIKELTMEYPTHLAISSKGIHVLKPMLKNDESKIPIDFKERESFILRKLLINDCSIHMDLLCDQLCISITTLENEIKRIRKHILPYHLTLKTKNGELFIVGHNDDKKALIIHSIYGEAKNSIVSLATLSELFQEYNIEEIRGMILEELDNNKFFIDEYSLINLLLHILIAMDQNNTNHKINDASSNDLIDLNRHFITIIDTICNAIEHRYKIKFTNNNKYQFTLLLMTRAIRNKEIDNQEVVIVSVSKEIDFLVNIIIQTVHKTYDIDLNANNFKLAFSLHLKNMLIRLNAQISVHNPLLFNIKATSPFIYDIAVYISNIIKEHEHVILYEDEIAYIALHIGARIEELNSIKSKLRTALVCPQYYSYQNSQFKKIEAIYKDDIMIDLIITNPSDMDEESYDLIISTIPIDGFHNSVLISNFFNDADKTNIHNMIQNIKKDKEKAVINQEMHTLFDEDFYNTNITFPSREDAIISMSEKLIKKSVVSGDFTEKLFEREAMSPTNFDMIAIPHPIDYFANRTVISVSVLKQPIVWGNTMVKIIFMFPISEGDFSRFSNIFGFLANLCNHNEYVELLAATKRYEDFLEYIIEIYDNI